MKEYMREYFQKPEIKERQRQRKQRLETKAHKRAYSSKQTAALTYAREYLHRPKVQERRRQRPVMVEVRLPAAEHAVLAGVAKVKRMYIATLILDTLRQAGLLGRA
jgi:hypothetical protein